MTDRETLLLQLQQARAARHKLLTGAQAVEVIQDGYSVKFTAANREALEAYIAELEENLHGVRRRGAVGFVF